MATNQNNQNQPAGQAGPKNQDNKNTIPKSEQKGQPQNPDPTSPEKSPEKVEKPYAGKQ